MMHIRSRRLAIAVAIAMASSITACAATPQGAQRPPDTWVAVAGSRNCEALSGTYAAEGTPTAENPRAPIRNSTWPVSSLGSLIDRDVSPRSTGAVAVVSINVDPTGRASFSAQDTHGQAQPLQSRNWSCEGGKLVMRTRLDDSSTSPSARRHEESYVRLWKSSEGALIAEETIDSAERHLRRSSAIHRALARFYFRFPAATPTSFTPLLSAPET